MRMRSWKNRFLMLTVLAASALLAGPTVSFADECAGKDASKSAPQSQTAQPKSQTIGRGTASTSTSSSTDDQTDLRRPPRHSGMLENRR